MSILPFFSDIAAFHKKFGLEYQGPIRRLKPELADFRYKFMIEEVDELHELQVVAPSAAEQREMMADQLDAFVDQLYVMLGTYYMMGFTPDQFDEAWARVQKANMSKVRAEKASDSKRGSTFDVVKPRGWVAPDHVDLIVNFHWEGDDV